MQNIKTKLLNIQGFKKETISRVNLSKSIFLGLVIALASQNEAKAQLTVTGQVRTRTELREGQGTLQKKGDDAALFTSQRTRLNVGFAGYRYKIFAALQDVRVWGQDASTNNRITTEANNGLMVHEAWAELILNDTISKFQNISLKSQH